MARAHKVRTAEEIGNSFGLTCPECKKGDNLRLAFNGLCSLTIDGTEDDGDHEWDNDSFAMCRNCDWQGTVRELGEEEVRDDG